MRLRHLATGTDQTTHQYQRRDYAHLQFRKFHLVLLESDWEMLIALRAYVHKRLERRGAGQRHLIPFGSQLRGIVPALLRGVKH